MITLGFWTLWPECGCCKTIADITTKDVTIDNQSMGRA